MKSPRDFVIAIDFTWEILRYRGYGSAAQKLKLEGSSECFSPVLPQLWATPVLFHQPLSTSRWEKLRGEQPLCSAQGRGRK